MQHLILPEISAPLPGSPVLRGSLGTRPLGLSTVFVGVPRRYTDSALKVVVNTLTSTRRYSPDSRVSFRSKNLNNSNFFELGKFVHLVSWCALDAHTVHGIRYEHIAMDALNHRRGRFNGPGLTVLPGEQNTRRRDDAEYVYGPDPSNPGSGP